MGGTARAVAQRSHLASSRAAIRLLPGRDHVACRATLAAIRLSRMNPARPTLVQASSQSPAPCSRKKTGYFPRPDSYPLADARGSVRTAVFYCLNHRSPDPAANSRVGRAGCGAVRSLPGHLKEQYGFRNEDNSPTPVAVSCHIENKPDGWRRRNPDRRQKPAVQPCRI